MRADSSIAFLFILKPFVSSAAAVLCHSVWCMNAENPFTITELFMTAARANEMQSSQNVGGLLLRAYQTHSAPHFPAMALYWCVQAI